MPISPSDLPWWGWFLVGLACGLIALIIWIFGESSRVHDGDRWIFQFPAVVAGIAMFVCGLIGVIRFIKWVWRVEPHVATAVGLTLTLGAP
jgi:hypothetical protein